MSKKMNKLKTRQELNIIYSNVERSLAMSKKSFEKFNLKYFLEENISNWGSVYVRVSNINETESLFKIRISDHVLPDSCVTRAGVFWDIYTNRNFKENGSFLINQTLLYKLIKWYNLMTDVEKEDLWYQGERYD